MSCHIWPMCQSVLAWISWVLEDHLNSSSFWPGCSSMIKPTLLLIFAVGIVAPLGALVVVSRGTEAMPSARSMRETFKLTVIWLRLHCSAIERPQIPRSDFSQTHGRNGTQEWGHFSRNSS